MSCKLFEKIPARHVLCFMFLTGFIVSFMIRVNINLTIVAMVKPERNATEEYAEVSNDTVSEQINSKIAREEGFEWDEFQQGLILGSFFYGYMISQIPGGRFSEIYGMKVVFGVGVLANGLLSLVIPLFARTHWILLFLIRASQGLAQGVMYPALSSSVKKWVPLNERATFISITVQGCSIGPVIALPLCGWILTTWEWPAVFYSSGAMAVVWYFFWLYLVYNDPEQHPRISKEEKKILKVNKGDKEAISAPPLPWKKTLLSFQFWLGAIAHVGSDWGFHTFYTYGPKYIKDALNFDISQSALLSSLPFLCQYIAATLIGMLVDRLMTKYQIPVRLVRKISVFFSHCMPGMLVILLNFTNSNVTLSLVIFTMAVTMLGALTTGHYQNPIDIAPNFAGSLTGIANTLGSLGGILCTTIAGASLRQWGTPEGWHAIFYVTASVYGMTSLPFILWAKSTKLPWNSSQSKTKIDLQNVQSSENGEAAESKLLEKNSS